MKFIKDTGSTFLTFVLNFILGLLTSIIIARNLGPEGQGIYSLVLILPTLIIVLTHLGISRSIIFHLAKDEFDKDILIKNIWFLSFILIIISVITGILTVIFFRQILFQNISISYLIFGIILIPLQFIFLQTISGILVGIQKIRVYNILSLFQNFIIFVLIIYFLIIAHNGIFGAFYSIILSLLITNIFAFLWISKILKIKLSFGVNNRILSEFSIFGIKVYFGNLMSFLRSRADVFLINYFLNPQSVGLYAISFGVAEMLLMFSQSVSNVLSPKISSIKDENRINVITPILLRQVLLISIILAFLIFIFSKWLILSLYSSEYLFSITPLNILLLGTVAVSLERILSTDIIARGYPLTVSKITFFVVLINITINLFLIPIFGIIGAAIASTISYNINLIITLYIYLRISKNSIKDLFFIKKSDFYIYSRVYKKIKKKL